MARSELFADDFGAGISGSYDNGPGDANPLEADSGNVRAPAASDGVLVRNTGTFAADQYAIATIANLAAGDNGIQVVVRHAGGTTEACYFGMVYGGSGDPKYSIYEVDNSNVATLLASAGDGGAVTGPAPAILEAEGTALRFLTDEGAGEVQRCATTDGTLNSGRGGCGAFNAGTANDATITSLSAGDLVGVTVSTVTPDEFEDAETGIVISGTGFGASQGAGRVVISPVDDIDGEPSEVPAVVHQVVATSTANPTTTFPITVPASGLQDGDLFEVTFISRDHTSGDAHPTVTDDQSGSPGWSQAGFSANRQAHVFYRRYTAGVEGATITVAGCIGSSCGALTIIRGALASGNPYTDFVWEENASGNESHATFTPSNANSLVGFIVANDTNDTLTVSSMAAATLGTFEPETYNDLSSGGNDCAIYVSHRGQAGAAAATGTFSWSQTNATTISGTYAIRPKVPAGAAVEQTVTAWSDTSVTFTGDQDTLALDTDLYLFVENDGGQSNSAGYVVRFVDGGGQEGDLSAGAGLGVAIVGIAGAAGALTVGTSLGTTQPALAAALGVVEAPITADASQTGHRDVPASVTAGLQAASSEAAISDAVAVVTAGIGAGSTDAGAAAGVAAATLPLSVQIAAEALSAAAAAVAAGLVAGESWAGHAQAAADLAADGEFGATFDGEVDGAETGALSAGTEAAAQFIAAAQAIGSVAPGADLGIVLSGIAQAAGAVSAGSSATLSAAAVVVAYAAANIGAALGQMWAGHAQTMASLAAAGSFGAQFDEESSSAEAGSLSAATGQAVAFAAACQALGALTGTTTLGEALQALASAWADVTAGAALGASFASEGGETPILPPAKATLEVQPRTRGLRIAPRSRAIRLIPRVRSTRIH